MTRARKWQLRQRAKGNCTWCGVPAGGFARCETHRVWFRAYAKKCREKDLEKSRAKDREKSKRLREGDPEKFRARSRRNYAKNPEKMRAQAVKSRARNLEKVQARERAASPRKVKRNTERRRSDPLFRLSCYLRARVSRAIRRSGTAKTDSTLSLVGCSIDDLMIYLESKFEPGMSWENYGPVWHVDHIMPCAIFDLSKPEHQKRCFHFSNLQPLFAEDNLKKNAKVLTNQFNLL